MTCLLDFPCSLQSGIAAFTSEVPDILIKSLLVGFSRGILLFGAVTYFFAFVQEYPLHSLCSLLWQNSLSFYVFSGSYHSVADRLQEISCFPEDGAIAPVCGCSLAHQSWCVFLTGFTCLILAAAPRKCIRTWPQSMGDRSLAFIAKKGGAKRNVVPHHGADRLSSFFKIYCL